MGFTPRFLSKYGTSDHPKKHPVLNRRLAVMRKWFRHRCRDGKQQTRLYDLFALKDLTSILDARRKAGINGSDRMVTVGEAAARLKLCVSTVRQHLRSGRIRSSGVKTEARRRHGQNGVQFTRCLKIPLDALLRPIAEGIISFPDAARKSGIPLATWHTWRRKTMCDLLGRSLGAEESNYATKHGHYRRLPCISNEVYNEVLSKYRDAQSGRFQGSDGDYYLSPLRAETEFFLGTSKTPASMVLANRKRYPSRKAQPPDSLSPWLLSEPQGKVNPGRLLPRSGPRNTVYEKEAKP